MPNMYDSLTGAIAAHWKAHDNRYPQKVVLTPAQFDELIHLRGLGRQALGDDSPVPTTDFLGVPLEQDPATPGILIAHDGSDVSVAA